MEVWSSRRRVQPGSPRVRPTNYGQQGGNVTVHAEVVADSGRMKRDNECCKGETRPRIAG